MEWRIHKVIGLSLTEKMKSEAAGTQGKGRAKARGAKERRKDGSKGRKKEKKDRSKEARWMERKRRDNGARPIYNIRKWTRTCVCQLLTLIAATSFQAQAVTSPGQHSLLVARCCRWARWVQEGEELRKGKQTSREGLYQLKSHAVYRAWSTLQEGNIHDKWSQSRLCSMDGLLQQDQESKYCREQLMGILSSSHVS